MALQHNLRSKKEFFDWIAAIRLTPFKVQPIRRSKQSFVWANRKSIKVFGRVRLKAQTSRGKQSN